MLYTECIPLPPFNLALVPLLLHWVVPKIDNNFPGRRSSFRDTMLYNSSIEVTLDPDARTVDADLHSDPNLALPRGPPRNRPTLRSRTIRFLAQPLAL